MDFGEVGRDEVIVIVEFGGWGVVEGGFGEGFLGDCLRGGGFFRFGGRLGGCWVLFWW